MKHSKNWDADLLGRAFPRPINLKRERSPPQPMPLTKESPQALRERKAKQARVDLEVAIEALLQFGPKQDPYVANVNANWELYKKLRDDARNNR